jgi:hypothetical protein
MMVAAHSSDLAAAAACGLRPPISRARTSSGPAKASAARRCRSTRKPRISQRSQTCCLRPPDGPCRGEGSEALRHKRHP